jgi:hypothetical protein
MLVRPIHVELVGLVWMTILLQLGMCVLVVAVMNLWVGLVPMLMVVLVILVGPVPVRIMHLPPLDIRVTVIKDTVSMVQIVPIPMAVRTLPSVVAALHVKMLLLLALATSVLVLKEVMMRV